MIRKIKNFVLTAVFFILMTVSFNGFAATSDLLDVADSTYGMSFGNSYTPKFINSVADYVDTSTGNFDFFETDVTVPGKNGFNMQLKRRFNSYTSAGELYEVEFGSKKKCLIQL